MKSNRTKNIRRFSAYKITDPVVPDAVVDADGSSHRTTSLIGAIGGERGSRTYNVGTGGREVGLGHGVRGGRWRAWINYVGEGNLLVNLVAWPLTKGKAYVGLELGRKTSSEEWAGDV